MGRAITCPVEVLLGGECVQGDMGPALSSPAHGKEKSRVFHHSAGDQLCQKPGQSWHEVGFVFQCDLSPNGHPRPLHRAIKHHFLRFIQKIHSQLHQLDPVLHICNNLKLSNPFFPPIYHGVTHALSPKHCCKSDIWVCLIYPAIGDSQDTFAEFRLFQWGFGEGMPHHSEQEGRDGHGGTGGTIQSSSGWQRVEAGVGTVV